MKNKHLCQAFKNQVASSLLETTGLFTALQVVRLQRVFLEILYCKRKRDLFEQAYTAFI